MYSKNVNILSTYNTYLCKLCQSLYFYTCYAVLAIGSLIIMFLTA
jgi:hypothetical protein